MTAKNAKQENKEMPVPKQNEPKPGPSGSKARWPQTLEEKVAHRGGHGTSRQLKAEIAEAEEEYKAKGGNW